MKSLLILDLHGGQTTFHGYFRCFQGCFAARRTREHATPRDTQHVLKQHVKQHAPDGVPPSGNAKDALDTVASLRDDLQVRVSPG